VQRVAFRWQSHQKQAGPGSGTGARGQDSRADRRAACRQRQQARQVTRDHQQEGDLPGPVASQRRAAVEGGILGLLSPDLGQHQAGHTQAAPGPCQPEQPPVTHRAKDPAARPRQHHQHHQGRDHIHPAGQSGRPSRRAWPARPGQGCRASSEHHGISGPAQHRVLPPAGVACRLVAALSGGAERQRCAAAPAASTRFLLSATVRRLRLRGHFAAAPRASTSTRPVRLPVWPPGAAGSARTVTGPLARGAAAAPRCRRSPGRCR
jgi:hypothetical protein